MTLPGQDKPGYIGTIMCRNGDRFVSIPHKGYWIADLPCEAANYKPGDVFYAEGRGRAVELRRQQPTWMASPAEFRELVSP